VQRIIRSILYSAQAVDLTVIMTLRTIASKKLKGTQHTMLKTNQHNGLLGNTSRYNGKIPCIWHDIERQLEGILPI
jgi:hypothetical protein